MKYTALYAKFVPFRILENSIDVIHLSDDYAYWYFSFFAAYAAERQVEDDLDAQNNS